MHSETKTDITMDKKIILSAAVLALAVLSGCKKPNTQGPQQTKAPEITWPANPEFAEMPITPQMDINLNITAEAGIKTFVVEVSSDALSPVISSMTSDNSTSMDLIGDEALTGALGTLLGDKAFPMGDELKDATSVDFSLSELVPMILMLSPEDNSLHSFTLRLSDNEDRSLEQELRFRYTASDKPAEYSIEAKDENLWTKSLGLSVSGAPDPASVKVKYRKKGDAGFTDAASEGNGAFRIVPSWTESTNEAGLKVFSAEGGISAGCTYEIEVYDNGEKVLSHEYAVKGSGDSIPNGDMSGWTTVGDSEKPLPYPNAAGDSLWTSGNNIYNYPLFGDGDPTFLCSEDNGAASMQAVKVLGAVFAAGNLFTGSFRQNGTAGVASFGQKYAWTARPKALRVKVKYTTGAMDSFGTADPEKEELEASKPVDRARIFVAVTDWNGRHDVESGLGVEESKMNIWNPETQTETQEGKILGYASMYFDGTTEEYQTVEIPFVWYDTQAVPSADCYSIVIACTTSERGDYLTGCSGNKLWADDFEWVY